MSASIIGAAVKVALDLFGPVVVDRVRRAVEKAGGKFRSDFRRRSWVRREIRRAIREERRILRVPRSTSRWLAEVLVMEWREKRGKPLLEVLGPPKPLA